MNIIDGKRVAESTLRNLKNQIEHHKIHPGLCFILVGNHSASQAYVKMKKKRCEEIGIDSTVLNLPEATTEEDLLSQIALLNENKKIHGIIVQEPLPAHIDPKAVHLALDPSKDVDGFHPINVGKLLMGDITGFPSCTPYGIIKLLEAYNIQTSGKHVVVIGRSNIVGKPLAALLLQKGAFADATLTVVHSKTKNIEEHCKRADILIAALGSPHFVKASMVKEDSVVIDVGINRIEKNGETTIVGDVDFENVAEKCSYITPVPGGVGPMTIAMLLTNTVESALRSK
ncbi:MAG: bifunctional 5,10-methylenetetrahydrofolate dehydrogenase/5,10-methenyltetrahydrofolate cyclohydrolase [Chlamydiae bacterium]|nr:bifunctional 5,10-methylenetetrahydrofolate dehydrogenase/5,10-methenyltetrahydrofolate cyclohydrolase [Chlamydiota bacterium]